MKFLSSTDNFNRWATRARKCDISWFRVLIWIWTSMIQKSAQHSLQLYLFWFVLTLWSCVTTLCGSKRSYPLTISFQKPALIIKPKRLVKETTRVNWSLIPPLVNSCEHLIELKKELNKKRLYGPQWTLRNEGETILKAQHKHNYENAHSK